MGAVGGFGAASPPLSELSPLFRLSGEVEKEAAEQQDSAEQKAESCSSREQMEEPLRSLPLIA